MTPEICDRHRKELLRFLLIKTAPVRSGAKPAALLRVQHCYSLKNAEGFQFCLYRKDIYEILQLNYIELLVEPASSLVLFYHAGALKKTLANPCNSALLKRCSYPQNGNVRDLLEHLKKRFNANQIPHEVGVFIGYPTKDVIGFMLNLPRSPIHNGDWQIFGQTDKSLELMRFYRRIEKLAAQIIDFGSCDLATFLRCTSKLPEKIFQA